MRSLPLLLRGVRSIVLWACGLSALAAQAQSAPTRPDPLDAQAPVPAVTYQSPLRGHRPLGEWRPVPWRSANDTVNRIGGWRTYARQAQQPDAAASVPASAPSHGHHHPGGQP